MAALCLAHARRQFFDLADIVSRTMQPSVLFEDLRLGESRGSSPVPSAALTERRPKTC
jgi:hypothetical protein